MSTFRTWAQSSSGDILTGLGSFGFDTQNLGLGLGSKSRSFPLNDKQKYLILSTQLELDQICLWQIG